MGNKGGLLRTQLLTRLLAPLAALLIADALVSYGIALSFAEKAYDRSLVETAHELAWRLLDANGALKQDLEESPSNVLRNDPVDRVFFEVGSADGRTLFGETLPHGPSDQRKSGAAEQLYDAVIDGTPIRVVELSVTPKNSLAAPTLVRVAETMVKRNGMAREIVASVVTPQILLILIAGMVVWTGVVRGLSPLEQLQRQIAARSHLDLSPLVEHRAPGEVRPLIHSINELMQRLNKVLTLQSRFLADAAHQLKTPVAGLGAQLELLMRETDPARQREATGKLYVGVERLSRLVSQLLALARNEPDAIHSIALQPTDLNSLAFEATADWVPESLKRCVDLGFEGPETPVIVNGEAARLRELIDNLLDNAIRYSQDGGRVTVRVRASPEPSVSVSDDGPRIPVGERKRIFQRFHRLLGQGNDGTGLGLAIALEIARIHSAEIRLQDDADGVGNTFTVRFPPLAEHHGLAQPSPLAH
jgi:two-component system, OmpR family, sensor histidine kinase TctE